MTAFTFTVAVPVERSPAEFVTVSVKESACAKAELGAVKVGVAVLAPVRVTAAPEAWVQP